MAVGFLPPHIRQLMNLLASLEPNRGSGLSVSALAVFFPMVVVIRSIPRRRRHRIDSAVRGSDGVDGAVGVETQLVDKTAVGAGHADAGDHFRLRQTWPRTSDGDFHRLATAATAELQTDVHFPHSSRRSSETGG